MKFFFHAKKLHYFLFFSSAQRRTWKLNEKPLVLQREHLALKLKVVCNEKGGELGRWQRFAIGLGPCRFVCRLILLSSLILICFRFRQVKLNLYFKAMSSWKGKTRQLDPWVFPLLLRALPIAALNHLAISYLTPYRSEQFAAFCLFMGTSLINFALLGRNGNKDRRQN